MKILIIGSEGFIGRHCVTWFLKNNWEVYGCDLSDHSPDNYNYTKILRSPSSFDVLFSGVQYDACINAAGNGSVPASVEYPVNDFDANCSDVIRILEFIKQKNGNCKYIHISSAAVYGTPEKLPVSEDDLIIPLSPYGWHKYMSEILCREYFTLHQLQIAIVRPFSIYGPGLYKQLFWDLYQQYKSNPEEVVLWGNGHESRDFIYITDVIEALNMVLLNSPMEANVYNLASGVETTIESAARQFINKFNSSIKIKFNNKQRPGDPLNWKADLTAIHSLGYKSKYTFANGIEEIALWLRK